MNYSLKPTEAAPAGARNSGFLRRDGETRQTCANCRAEIVDDHWFCRLPGNEGRVILCSPFCAMLYFERSPAERNGGDADAEANDRRPVRVREAGETLALKGI